ncbi:ATP-dependent nuclease [Nocardia kruczakiae]|uniref:ATP-dependent nuclease n=1 Tax=Nocardia kruczakiae TaxID=261477 RepID=UPI0007A39D78|nr:AAA family ATPase [Nocardia kruczakiae]
MRIKTLYIRFYKSFNYDYLRKSDTRAAPDPWDVVNEQDPRFFPFVQLSLEREISTVVGANESGKSQVISAVKCLLTGAGIERRDFCRYSELLAVDKEMAAPEFGGEFGDLTDEEREVLRGLLGADADNPLESFWMFRLNKGVRVYGRQAASAAAKPVWLSTTLTDAQIKKITLPTFFEIHANVPLPSSVPLEYLTAAKTKKPAFSREGRLRFFRTLFDDTKIFETTDALTKAAEKVVTTYASYAGVTDDDLHARLELAEKLLFDVGQIDKSSFIELQKAVEAGSGAEGWANGLVRKMNAQLADALNFPKWWSQDAEFSVYLTLRDFDLIFTVRDRTGQEYSFGERSSGMSYFLSYFVRYRSHVPAGNQEILLMDEPDTYLSMQGQQDLLRIFADFAAPEEPDTAPIQVLYVTHSPFLIDKNHGERIRVLEKGEGDEGSRVVENAAKNHYEPLRSAFGAFVAETTFIGNCNLMLEGQADQVLLAGLSSLARRLGTKDTTLDLNTLTLVPAGGAEHIPYMVYLARGRDVDKPAVTVLLDSDDEGNRQAAELRRGYRGKRLVDDAFIIQVGGLDADKLATDVGAPIEIEDLIPAEVLRLAVIRFAREVLSQTDADHIAEHLTIITPQSDEKLFKAAERMARAASPNQDRPLDLDKVGVARAVLHVVEKEVSSDLRDRTLANFTELFRLLDRAQRSATRKKANDLTTRNLKDLRTRFERDHPTTATRRQVEELLDNMLDQLRENNVQADKVRDTIRGIRVDFKLDVDPMTPVEKFDALKQALAEIVYRPVLDAQEAAPSAVADADLVRTS